MAGDDPELTAVEAAERFGESLHTIRSAVQRGLIPSRIVGPPKRGLRLVRASAVAAYIEGRNDYARSRVASHKPVSKDV